MIFRVLHMYCCTCTAEQYGTSVDAVCLAAVMAQLQFAPLVLSGAASAEHLTSNVRAGQVSLGRAAVQR